MTRLVWSKRKSVAAVVVCVILAAASVALWHASQSAEAAVLEPHPGLVGWWRFDEGSGTVAGDSSGYGNSGTIYGATWVTGKYGEALSFDGGAITTVPNSPSIKNFSALTLIMWVKIPAYTGTTRGLLDFGYWSSPYGLLMYLDGSSNTLNLLAKCTNGNVASDTYTFTPDTWTMVGILWDGTNFRRIVNGVLGTAKSLSGIIDPTANFILGSGAGDKYNGVLDEVRIYNRALSAAEIQADFQKSPDFSSKLLAKVPKGATQVITTLSWQGVGSINVTIQSPSQNYTENIVPVYQKTVYSTTGGTSSMLNIKRLSITVTALSSDENWYVMLELGNVEDYRITFEVQK